MSDFLNQNIAVPNSDANGLYPWMSIRAGGNFNVFGNLKTVRPINLGGYFIYNQSNLNSAAMYTYNNVVSSGIGAGQQTPILYPAGLAGVTLENESIGEFEADINYIRFTKPPAVTDTRDYYLYARLVLTSSSLQGGGDQIRVGFQVNGAGAATLTQTVTVPPLGADPTTVVIYGLQNFPAIVTGVTTSYVEITIENLTNNTRGIIASSLQYIGAAGP